MLKPMKWNSQGKLDLIDQRLLPQKEKWIQCCSLNDVIDAIKKMVVRGAPAIGITAAYGMVLAVQDFASKENAQSDTSVRGGLSEHTQRLMDYIFSASERLTDSRPTAVNLEWAVKIQVEKAAELINEEPSEEEIFNLLLKTAQDMHKQDIECNQQIGKHGAELFYEGDRVLTHCNAGALATGGYGTALGVIRAAHEAEKNVQAYATETRPFLQGARLTCWELAREGVPVNLIVDSAPGFMMSKGKLDAVVVGADRVVRNGDTANKIGTYQLALAANDNSIPFYVAIPTSTLDWEVPDARGIEIEQRDAEEVTHFAGEPVCPDMIRAHNYAFDITPAELIDGIITEHGVVEPPFERNFKRILDMNC